MQLQIPFSSPDVSGAEENVGYVYCLWDGVDQICRIGRTMNGDRKRPLAQVSYLPHPVLLSAFIKVIRYKEIERSLFGHFSSYRLMGDWFRIRPSDFMNTIQSGMESGAITVLDLSVVSAQETTAYRNRLSSYHNMMLRVKHPIY